MANVDSASFPQALAIDEPRVHLDTGKPTRATLDNEHYLLQWVQDNTQALDHAVITAQSTAAGAAADAAAASASVIIEAATRATADSAEATARIQAEARATGGSAATAQMQLVASAGIPGAAAEFSWELRSSGSNFPVGMTAYAAGATGSIAFTAQKFSLTDPSYLSGAPGNVFSYSAGKWRFGVPVELVTGELASNAVTSIASNTGIIAGTGLTTTKSFYGGTDAMVIVTLETAGGLSPTPSAAQTITQRTYNFYVDGVLTDTLTAYDQVVGSNNATVRDAAGVGTTVVVGALYTGPANVAKLFFVSGLAAGSHSFGIQELAGLSMLCKIAVVEFKR